VPKRDTLLLIDTGVGLMETLSQRLRAIGYRVLRTKNVEQGYAALCDRRFDIRVGLIPPDLPVPDLARALEALRVPTGKRAPRFLATGAKPEAAERQLLRGAGVELALWVPFDDHTLQFQVNRASAVGKSPPRRRQALRVPNNWPVRVATGKREKQARIYSVSAQGAYLATSRPSLPKALIHFSLPLPSGDLRLAGEVVMTNVPGNLVRGNLPVGMGVRFKGMARETEHSILTYAEERAETLLV
jgi:response regulator RpfG family c-di-GMP phosphodiesterase